jgi:Arc/MetJ family transcription regulator
MKVTIDIDDDLLKMAKELFPDMTISEIVNMALKSYVENLKKLKNKKIKNEN